ncbi:MULTISPECIES: hypothetical protein [unclassified Helicobacter]|nr:MULTISPECIES: hypothetical protein [unclassified Helicobacter]
MRQNLKIRIQNTQNAKSTKLDSGAPESKTHKNQHLAKPAPQNPSASYR